MADSGQVSSPRPAAFDAAYLAERTGQVLLAAGNTVLLDMIVAGLTRLAVSVTLTVQAFDAFIIEFKVHPSDPWHTLTSAVTATPAGQVLAAGATLATLAKDTSTGWVLLNVDGFYGVRISASAATDGAVVDSRAFGK